MLSVPVAGIEVPTFYHRTSDVADALGNAFSRDAVIGIRHWIGADPDPAVMRAKLEELFG